MGFGYEVLGVRDVRCEGCRVLGALWFLPSLLNLFGTLYVSLCCSQVNSKLPAVSRLEDAVEGLVTHGWVTGVKEYGCFISFYNEIKGLAHK